MKYQLKSVISLVNDNLGCYTPTQSPTPSSPIVTKSKQHLVCHSLKGQQSQQSQQGQQEMEKEGEGKRESGWFLFNDFCINPSSEEDSLLFTQPWKTPICFLYENVDCKKDISLSALTVSSSPSFYSTASLGAPNM